MTLKLLKGGWFLSMVIALCALLYVYAGLPQEVIVQNEGGAIVSVSNEAFFYIVMLFMAITNAMVYIISKVFYKKEDFRAWFYGLIMSLNFFFVIALNFISVYNSNERFDYSRIAFIIYGSVGLIIAWAFSWPVYLLFKRINSKSLV